MWGLNCIVNIVIIIIIHPIIKWVFKRNIQKSFRDAFKDDIDYLEENNIEDKQVKKKRLLREREELNKMIYGTEIYVTPKSERRKKKINANKLRSREKEGKILISMQLTINN